MRRVIRGIIDSVVEGAIKRVTMKGAAGETISNRECFQHYGYTSRPLPGAEGVLIREGNHIILIGSDDRRYRIALEEGEVAIYDDQGQKVHLGRNGQMHVVCTNKLTADVANDVEINTARAAVNASESCTVTSPLVKAVASTKVLLDTPLTECTGDLAVAGNGSFGGGLTMTGTAGSGDITSPGDISDGTRSMSADRSIYNGHTHPGDSGGTTGAPNQQQ